MWAAPWMHSHALGACWKCGGSGRIEAYRYIEGGVCFACDGTGSVRGRKRKRPVEQAAPVERIEEPRRGRERLSSAGARDMAMHSLEEAGRWFEISENPKRLFPQGGVNVKTMQEIYGYIGTHVGDSVVDHAVFEVALRKARRRVPAAYRDVFEAAIFRSVADAADEFEGIDTTIPTE